MGRDLRGRTAGVLGTGKIGEAFTRIAHGFGMNLLGWDLVENPRCVGLGMKYVPASGCSPRRIWSASTSRWCRRPGGSSTPPRWPR